MGLMFCISSYEESPRAAGFPCGDEGREKTDHGMEYTAFRKAYAGRLLYGETIGRPEKWIITGSSAARLFGDCRTRPRFFHWTKVISSGPG